MQDRNLKDHIAQDGAFPGPDIPPRISGPAYSGCAFQRPHPPPLYTSHRITPTLIALIIVFITCVSPSALLFVIGVGDAAAGSRTSYHVYQTTIGLKQG